MDRRTVHAAYYGGMKYLHRQLARRERTLVKQKPGLRLQRSTKMDIPAQFVGHDELTERGQAPIGIDQDTDPSVLPSYQDSMESMMNGVGGSR
jgi:hypothetical protein